jgi:hypothetical protein
MGTNGVHACSEREKDTVMVMRRVVASYFNIVRNTMKDLVPKVIMRFVVSHTADVIHGHLISKILRCASEAFVQQCSTGRACSRNTCSTGRVCLRALTTHVLTVQRGRAGRSSGTCRCRRPARGAAYDV